MISLIIDTSCEKPFVSIAENSIPILNFFLPSGPQCSRHLMPCLEESFLRLKLSVNDLAYIAVATGPGSYTGIRVGAAAAKGLSAYHGIPLVAFSALEAYIPDHEGLFASVMDARTGGSYVMFREKKKNYINNLSSPQLLSKEKLDNLRSAYSIIGPSTADADLCYLARMISERFAKGDSGKDLKMLYLRQVF
jgi:tRNA threonylcarbamoyladenosine biosynthesis protein TsaB